MIIEGSNPPTSKEYPQAMYWVNWHDMTVTRVVLVRNCGWHSMIHVTEDGKSVRDERLFSDVNEAITHAGELLAELALELKRQTENFNESVVALLAGGEA